MNVALAPSVLIRYCVTFTLVIGGAFARTHARTHRAEFEYFRQEESPVR